MDHPPELDPGLDTYARWLRTTSDFVLAQLERAATIPASGVTGAPALDVAEAIRRDIPEAGLAGGLDACLQTIERGVAASMNTYGPGYLAYIPGGGLVSAGLADLIADVTNRYTGMTAPAPALVQLEADVLRFLCREFGFGERGWGLLTPGGSTANLAGFVTARVDRLGEDGDFRHAVAYTSSQAHHSIEKSARLAGIPPQNLRAVPTDARFRMDVDALAAAIEEDRAAGMRPFLVIASAGTTNSGAVDPLREIAEVCARHEVWLHVDAAYGGAFVLCEEGRRRLAGLELADSVVFDPHKGMFLPYGTGCLLARDADELRRAHAGDAIYLQDFDVLERHRAAPSPADYGPELSRDFRGLRLWLPLMLHGAAAFRAALTDKLALAERIHAGLVDAIASGAPIEVVDAPQLSLVTFRLRRRDGEPLDDWNARNAAWHQAIIQKGRVHLSSTRLPTGDRGELAFTLRACVLSFRTTKERVDALLEDAIDLAG